MSGRFGAVVVVHGLVGVLAPPPRMGMMPGGAGVCGGGSARGSVRAVSTRKSPLAQSFVGRRGGSSWRSWSSAVLIVGMDAAAVEADLGAGGVRCPGCGAGLRPWG